jgi:hypothetical protein
MVAIPFPLGSAPGFVQQEAAGRLQNCFAEPLGENRADGAKRVRVPGMTSFATSSQTGFRGLTEINGTLYAAFNNVLYKCTSTGGALSAVGAGLLAGTKSVYFARNNKSPTPDQVAVTENGAFTFTSTSISGSPMSIPAQPNSVCSLDGYLVFTVADGRAYASALNDTPVNSLSFGRADAKPDGLVRGIAFSGRMLFFGNQSLEIWQDVGATPFPFQRASSIAYGLLAPDAVAGWEDGFGGGLLWVANDGTVRKLDGYAGTRVSPPDLERLIQRDASQSTLLASVHMVDGHPMWTITGSTYTWEYDVDLQRWHERASYLTNRWRGLQTWNAFGKWLVGDRNTGNIYSIDPTNFMEGTDPLRQRMETGPVEQFPQRVRVAQANFKIDTGIGIVTGSDPIQTDPTIAISWSDDGGMTWSNPLLRKMGRQAQYKKNIQVTRTGMSTRFGRRWRLDVADPVYIAYLAGDQSAELRVG